MSPGPELPSIPEALADVIAFRVEPEGHVLAAPIFRRRYRSEPPAFPHHVVAWYRGPEGEEPACYIHFTDAGGMLLGGGACADDRVLRRMSAEARQAVRAAGGLYRAALAWSVRHFSPQFPAVFGYCGDALAERVDLAVGFKHTGHPHLLVYFTQDIDAEQQRELIARANAVGPF